MEWKKSNTYKNVYKLQITSIMGHLQTEKMVHDQWK